MARIRSKNTKPELALRKLLHADSYRYRLHVRRLPGAPDIVFPSRRKVVFVHGCFWHQHDDAKCRDSRIPKSNVTFWASKMSKNVERDRKAENELKRLGWQVLVVWECEIRSSGTSALKRVKAFLETEEVMFEGVANSVC